MLSGLPRRPRRTPPRLLALWVALVATAAAGRDTVTTRPIAPGVTYASIRRSEGPCEIRVLRIERGASHVRLGIGLGLGTCRGFEQTSGIVARESNEDDYAVAAVNGDFYAMSGPTAGLALGPTVREGELVSSGAGRAAFLVTGDGTPLIGEFGLKGQLTSPHWSLPVTRVNHSPSAEGLCVYTAAWGWPHEGAAVVVRLDSLPLRSHGEWKGQMTGYIDAESPRPGEIVVTGRGEALEALSRLEVGDEIGLSLRMEGLDAPVQTAVGGGPLLLRDGKLIPEDDPAAPRHPRTAVGYNEKEIILTTLDGRQPGWSVGMRMFTLAELMLELGCTDALNLDGGGSTTCWVRGEITNQPSDGRERSVANAVLVRSTAPRGPLARLLARPEDIVAFRTHQVPMSLWLTDEWLNPVDASHEGVSLEVLPGGEGAVDIEYAAGVLSLGGGPGRRTVRLRHADCATATQELSVTVVDECHAVEVNPPTVHVCAGDRFGLTATGLLEDGTPVLVGKSFVTWQAEGEGVTHAGDGQFEVTLPGIHATITAQVGEVTGQAIVRSASWVPVEGFENAPEIAFTKFPETDVVSGRLSLGDDAPAEGTRCCRLTYNLGESAATRAAYLGLDRELGNALKLSFLARCQAEPPPWVRLAIVDGNGTRHTFTAATSLAAGEDWQRLEVRLPTGAKPPLTWQSVYVVAPAGKTSAGWLEVDDLQAARITE